MISKVKSLLKNRTYRFILVGGSVYLIELMIIVSAQAMGASTTVAVTLSYWITLVISFSLQKLFTFEDRRMGHRILLPQIIAAGSLILFNYLFTLTMIKLLEKSLPATVIRTIALATTTIWTYLIYKKHIFKSKSADPII